VVAVNVQGDAAAGILTPEQVGELIVRPITQQSVAMQACTVVRSASHVYLFPIVDEDAASQWVPEAQEITLSDPTVTELQVTPLKVAALVRVSTELAEDSSPEATTVVQESLARSIARSIDKAFFAASTENGPDGLLSVPGVQVIDAGSAFSNFDWAVDAKTALRKAGAEPSSFVASAETVGTLSSIKIFTGSDLSSNEPLLAATDGDVTQATPENVLGVPLIAVADGTALADNLIWGIDRHCHVKCVSVIWEDRSGEQPRNGVV